MQLIEIKAQGHIACHLLIIGREAAAINPVGSIDQLIITASKYHVRIKYIFETDNAARVKEASLALARHTKAPIISW